MQQLISSDERKRRELLLQVKYQTMILDHIAESYLNKEDYQNLTEKLKETKKTFKDKKLFVNFADWN